jgi:hypothetical protein
MNRMVAKVVMYLELNVNEIYKSFNKLYSLFAILENKGEKVFVLSNTALLPNIDKDPSDPSLL